jgi:excisionase family DNA binding protein
MILNRNIETNEPPLLTKEELAEFFKVKPRTIEHWMRRGWVPFYKIGKTVRFKMPHVQAALERMNGSNG